MALIAFVLWMVLSYLSGTIAEKKGRKFTRWVVSSMVGSLLCGMILGRGLGEGGGVLALIGFPLLTAIIAACIEENPAGIEARLLAKGMRKCPHCAELIKQEATLCRYCHSALTPAQTEKYPDKTL